MTRICAPEAHGWALANKGQQQQTPPGGIGHYGHPPPSAVQVVPMFLQTFFRIPRDRSLEPLRPMSFP